MGLRVIAIDGPAGSGKSTVARAVADRLSLEYLDTGAMYRSVAFAALRCDLDPADAEAVARMTADLDINVERGVVTVDGVDATIEIRGPEVTRAVSTVAANPEVRAEMRRRQRAWAAERGGGVMEGRDIGSVVFPDAVLKVYLTASPETRAGRRAKEVTDLDYETVAADIARRDALDQTRTDSPLTRPSDSVVIDTTDRTIDEIVDEVLVHLPAVDAGDAPVSEAVERPGHDARTWLGRPSRTTRVSYAIVRALIRVVATLFGRVRIIGAEKVPAHGAFVLAPVHRSNVDFALSSLLTRRPMRFMGKDSIWKSRALGRFVSMLGAYPVHRGAADRESLRVTTGIIEGGSPVVVFPEGARRTGPVVNDLFDGPAYLAARTGVPIVPLGIGGSERMMPKGAKFLRPSKLVLLVGDPIAPPAMTEGGRVSRSAVRALTERLEGEVQRLFDEAQRLAGSPNRPPSSDPP